MDEELQQQETQQQSGEQVEQMLVLEEEKNVLELKLSNFDGPLDLLLSLVKENKIEIKDIFVSQVTEQFLAYMDQVSELDVELASEYMAMSATLLEIKSRALLPILKELEPEEETTRRSTYQTTRGVQTLQGNPSRNSRSRKTLTAFTASRTKTSGAKSA